MKSLVKRALLATRCSVCTLKLQMCLLADLVLSKSWRVCGLNLGGNGTVSHSARYNREMSASYRLPRLAMRPDIFQARPPSWVFALDLNYDRRRVHRHLLGG